MYYQINKVRSRTRTTEPSMTDQSQRSNTDINVMLSGYKMGEITTGRGAAAAPQYEDYANVPGDLRDMIELSRQMPTTRNKLPPALRDIPQDQLLSLSMDELQAILVPPAKPPKQDNEVPNK